MISSKGREGYSNQKHSFDPLNLFYVGVVPYALVSEDEIGVDLVRFSLRKSSK